MTETNTSLTVDSQIGVDFTFSSKELTMNIDDYAARYLSRRWRNWPPRSKRTCGPTAKAVANMVDADTVAPALVHLNRARKRLTDSLAPVSDRAVLLSTDHTVKFVDALKGLFQDRRRSRNSTARACSGASPGSTCTSRPTCRITRPAPRRNHELPVERCHAVGRDDRRRHRHDLVPRR